MAEPKDKICPLTKGTARSICLGEECTWWIWFPDNNGKNVIGNCAMPTLVAVLANQPDVNKIVEISKNKKGKSWWKLK